MTAPGGAAPARAAVQAPVRTERRGGAREALPDALRALALLGVLMVNAIGYADLPSGPHLGYLRPEGSTGAALAQWFVATVFEGKAYPVLAFLFGYGLVLAQRGQAGRNDTSARLRARQWRLLALGVAHGTLLYMGDILTMYALCGLSVLVALDDRWPALRRRLRRALAWALGVTAFGVVVALLFLGMEIEPEFEPGFAQIRQAGDFLAANASAYAVAQFAALLLFFPVLRLCMLAGIAAARLRWLRHPRWHGMHARWARRWLWPLLALNAAFAAVTVADTALLGGRAYSPVTMLLESLAVLVQTPLAVVALCGLVQHARAHPQGRWRALLPLGQRTLSLYLGHSLLCLLLLSGVGLGWSLGSAGTVVWAALLWLAALWLAGLRPGPGVLERWLSGRTGAAR